ncbi:putative zinc finger domain-containing protein [Encephalitozoon intestinalis ATCC 50506]|uniref:Pre-mRNA-splicing factor CWC24 n=1 Tax=Encephalitozoon intestinalis (strain ATCC 50506) TaxID=876142 RepID=E0S7M7_ENCIT|nr:putative zinc finger domain-containing protein [Encephalitozoon intestinalis ATCC 50506]ADM11706.1 putative zinc finger domain-containing protein [Encephalitozoon intestinalis ATCC 50506]UTX45443.1 hypothetical protein GPK93_06g09970 [Encephalitozoon intestinalis]
MAKDNEMVETHKIICKPFRETGYCGYGDSCKYLHERSIGFSEMGMISDDDLLCGICKKTFEERVLTECGHSFCSLCAIKKYQDGDECNVCGKAVYGRFWMA